MAAIAPILFKREG